MAYMNKVRDIIINIKDDNAVWSKLLFVREFAAILKASVHAWELTMDMRLAPCTCNAQLTTSLRYLHRTLHQSTIVMLPPSLAGLGPNYQAQLDARKSEPFPTLKHDRQPPMLMYERELVIDERDHSSLYKQ